MFLAVASVGVVSAGAVHASGPPQHIIRRGQTLYSIARAYAVPLEQLARVNGIKNPARIRAGRKLVIPAGPAPTAQTVSNAPSAPIGPPFAPAALPLEPPPAPVAPPSSTESRLDWPVEGAVLSHFASPRRGHRHKGIDIRSSEGTPIRAVADGVVGIASDHYGAYGRLITIQHENGMTSYYGHNSKNLVREGQQVEAGEVIALVGHTGNARGDHLHFELHKSGQPLDPLCVLSETQPAATRR